MPIIIEGGSRCAGSWWAAHLQNTEKNERAKLVGIEGLSAETVPELFREMHAMSLGAANVKNYFYQANINPRADEHLTPEQRREAVATLGRNLGLDGQPHFVIEHEKAGRIHQHVIWLRVDMERMRAIPDSLTAQIHERTSRELEIKFDLERGKSILVANREFERPERRAKKHERFRGAQSGLDPRATANELKTLRERSDGPASFRAGMEAAGYVLARGDRRDYVVVDPAGQDYSLARQLGMKAAALREFMKTIDTNGLPSVADAKTRQRARANAREARQMLGRGAPGIAAAAGAENTAAAQPRKSREGELKAERPLNPTQGAIRAAWTLSRTGEQLTEALAARGIGLAQVTAKEARTNYRRRAFAKEVGRFAPRWSEGEIVAVNEKGHVYKLDPRTVGVERGWIEKRLAGIEADGLLGVTDTRQVMREVHGAERAEKRRHKQDKARQARERERPLNRVEERIILAERESRFGVYAQRDGENAHLTGAEALTATLEKAGIAVARVSGADVQALDALRREEDLARLVADANRESRRAQHFAKLEEGEIAAVDRAGNVHRLNVEKVDIAILVGELGEGRLSSVTEARSQFELEREALTVFREEMMNASAANARSQFDVERGPITPFDLGEDGKKGPELDDHGVREPGDVAGRMADSAVKVLGAMLEFGVGMFSAPKPPTKEQARQNREAAKETQAGRAERKATDERLAQTVDMSRGARARDEREEEERARQRERQREQELGRDR
jgi:hypothetical protein